MKLVVEGKKTHITGIMNEKITKILQAVIIVSFMNNYYNYYEEFIRNVGEMDKFFSKTKTPNGQNEKWQI